MNAVESLLTRLQIPEVIPRMRAKGIEKIVSLRGLPEEDLKVLVGNDEAYAKLTEAMSSRGGAQRGAAPPAASAGRYPGDDDRDRRGGRGAARGGSRGRGDGDWGRGRGRSRYTDQEEGPDGDDRPRRNHLEISHKCEEVVEVPTDGIRWLMGSSCAELLKIHHKFGTTNSKIVKSDHNLQSTMKLSIFGNSTEAVAGAKEQILRIMGVLAQEREVARFEYGLHELQHNLNTVNTLCAANTRNTGTDRFLSDAVLKRLVGTFRFAEPSHITHLSCVSATSDKDKFDVLAKCAKDMQGAQVIIFAEAKRVVEMAKSARCLRAFDTDKVFYVHPKIPKDERLALMEEFKKGAANANGVKNRVLVCTVDYAKYARKVLIPFVNFVCHFSMPKSREFFFLQSLCCGRNNTPGISLLFSQSFDVDVFKTLTTDFTFVDHTEAEFARAAKGLIYDTESAPLTSANADPPVNWREELLEEKEKKAAMKAERAKKAAELAGATV